MINGGIYAYNFKSDTDVEFKDIHPAITIQNNKQQELYYVIPLTTYTKERWKKYKQHFACRLLSVNSIALVHRMQIVHYKYIGKRYYSNGEPLVITNDEFDKVCEKLQLLITKSVTIAKNNSLQYHNDLMIFKNALEKILRDKTLTDNDLFIQTITQDYIELEYKNKVYKSYWQDYEHIIQAIIPNAKMIITDEKVLKIIIKILENPLTNNEKCDNL